MSVKISSETAKRIASAVKYVERIGGDSSRNTGKHRRQVDWILVKLTEALEAGGDATAKERYQDADGAWQDGQDIVAVHAWKQTGTLASGKEVWCLWWSGRWYALIPEECTD